MSLDLKLSGKTAIVTGGSAGIGLAIARAFYSEGVNVVIAARNPERLENAVSTIQLMGEVRQECRALGVGQSAVNHFATNSTAPELVSVLT